MVMIALHFARFFCQEDLYLYKLTKSIVLRYYATSARNTLTSSFGLEEQDIVKSVQGLYIDNELPGSNDHKLEKHKNFMTLHTEQENKQEPLSFLNGEVEKIRTSKFGSIRLDNDNPPADQKSDFAIDEQNLLNQKAAQSQKFSLQNEQTLEVELPQVVRKGNSSNESSPNNSKPNVCSDEPKLPQNTSDVPLVYKTHSYNELTHLDVWNILRKQIIFDNEFLLAINKPSGLPMHNPSIDCRHTVLDFFPEFAKFTNCQKIFSLHRLDKETTGVLLLGKTEKSSIVIRDKFANRELTKNYLAIIKGCPELNEGSIKIPIADGEILGTNVFRAKLKPDLTKYHIARNEVRGKDAVTHFKVIRSREHCAFLEVRPETGITHQIRVHLGMGLGCPVLGDHKYSHRDKLSPQRLHPSTLKDLKIEQTKARHLPLHLHCSNIKFTMPEGFGPQNEVFVHCRPPAYFMRSLRALNLSK